MKKIISLVVFTLLAFFAIELQAQNPLSERTQVFVSSGYVTPFFFGGEELLRSRDLRDQGKSYFQNTDGTRQDVGSYPTNAGFSLSIGFYKPLKFVRGLTIGALVNSGQTGSQPSEGGYAEGYFFNFLNVSMGLRYFPFTNNNLFVKAETGMSSVWTKNRFLNASGEQEFLHQFGIGLELGGGIGYAFTPFANKDLALNVEAIYQYHAPRVEVNGIGNDPWRFGALHLSGGIYF